MHIRSENNPADSLNKIVTGHKCSLLMSLILHDIYDAFSRSGEHAFIKYAAGIVEVGGPTYDRLMHHCTMVVRVYEGNVIFSVSLSCEGC